MKLPKWIPAEVNMTDMLINTDDVVYFQERATSEVYWVDAVLRTFKKDGSRERIPIHGIEGCRHNEHGFGLPDLYAWAKRQQRTPQGRGERALLREIFKDRVLQKAAPSRGGSDDRQD